MNDIFFENVTILGVGLIGASFARALRKNRLCGTITGCGRNKSNLEEALRQGIIDSFSLDAAQACANADLVMLSAPVGSFVSLIQKASSSLKKGAIITDAGSVKGKLVYDLERLVPQGVSYIGCHPIAGSDRTGIEASSEDLFVNARCVITPTSSSDTRALDAIKRLWKSLGANVTIIDPERHDFIYAAVSHFPHLMAYALVNTIAEIDPSFFAMAGQGLRDTTRIAASSAELWRDICIMNRENMISIIDAYCKKLNDLRGSILSSDGNALETEFKKAREMREQLGQD